MKKIFSFSPQTLFLSLLLLGFGLTLLPGPEIFGEEFVTNAEWVKGEREIPDEEERIQDEVFLSPSLLSLPNSRSLNRLTITNHFFLSSFSKSVPVPPPELT